MSNEFIRQNSERLAKMFESVLEDNNSKSDKQASTEYTGVYTAIFPNKTPRELELEARVKELERKLEIAEKFLIEMVKGEKLFTDKDYLFRAKLALQKMEEVK